MTGSSVYWILDEKRCDRASSSLEFFFYYYCCLLTGNEIRGSLGWEERVRTTLKREERVIFLLKLSWKSLGMSHFVEWTRTQLLRSQSLWHSLLTRMFGWRKDLEKDELSTFLGFAATTSDKEGGSLWILRTVRQDFQGESLALLWWGGRRKWTLSVEYHEWFGVKVIGKKQENAPPC